MYVLKQSVTEKLTLYFAEVSKLKRFNTTNQGTDTESESGLTSGTVSSKTKYKEKLCNGTSSNSMVD